MHVRTTTGNATIKSAEGEGAAELVLQVVDSFRGNAGRSDGVLCSSCRRIRAKWGTRVRVLAITGWGQERDKRSAVESGFDAQLTKPADPAKLEEVIRLLGR